MPVKAEDLYKNKIRLIYEYNRKSPLFARIANWELENNNSETAIEIIENGLRENPEFPTPYFILGKAYSKTGDYNKALKCFKKGSELIHSKETYQFYLRELESLKNLKTPSDFYTSQVPEVKKEKINEGTSSNFEDNLDELAEKISKAKIAVIKEEKSSSQYVSEESASGGESSMIVSETLAKIYIAQGEIKEAITVYEKLKKKEPSRENYFSQKISE
ncbi:MAG TPA: tetratricopeptide repeat protein, partial [Ignavibacteriaceae bacterium]|nr:tetratricopeptide repeat protein [Ignavibacteriaceae bacterium]